MNKNFLNWFSGKGLEKAQAATVLLEQSIAQGSWVPGASRTVSALLSGKATVGKKLLSKVDSLRGRPRGMERLGVPAGENAYDSDYPTGAMGHNIDYALRFGSVSFLDRVDFALCRAAAAKETAPVAHMAAVDGAEQMLKDFAELRETVKRLDATRPLPVFTTMNASPTVSATIKQMGGVKVDVVEMEFKTIEYKNENGQTRYKMVAKLLWPAGTVHGANVRGNLGSNCEACGHRIHNPFNWIPFVLTTEAGTPKALWVGRDCAKTLFGVDMKGDLEIAP